MKSQRPFVSIQTARTVKNAKLLLAAMKGNYIEADEALKDGADVNVVDEMKKSALDLAVTYKRPKTAAIIRNAGGLPYDPMIGLNEIGFNGLVDPLILDNKNEPIEAVKKHIFAFYDSKDLNCFKYLKSQEDGGYIVFAKEINNLIRQHFFPTFNENDPIFNIDKRSYFFEFLHYLFQRNVLDKEILKKLFLNRHLLYIIGLFLSIKYAERSFSKLSSDFIHKMIDDFLKLPKEWQSTVELLMRRLFIYPNMVQDIVKCYIESPNLNLENVFDRLDNRLLYDRTYYIIVKMKHSKEIIDNINDFFKEPFDKTRDEVREFFITGFEHSAKSVPTKDMVMYRLTQYNICMTIAGYELQEYDDPFIAPPQSKLITQDAKAIAEPLGVNPTQAGADFKHTAVTAESMRDIMEASSNADPLQDTARPQLDSANTQPTSKDTEVLKSLSSKMIIETLRENPTRADADFEHTTDTHESMDDEMKENSNTVSLQNSDNTQPISTKVTLSQKNSRVHDVLTSLWGCFSRSCCRRKKNTDSSDPSPHRVSAARK